MLAFDLSQEMITALLNCPAQPERAIPVCAILEPLWQHHQAPGLASTIGLPPHPAPSRDLFAQL